MDKEQKEEIRKAIDEGWLPFHLHNYAIQKGIPKDKIDEAVAQLEKDIYKLLEQEE